jgi:hypothetical protein
MAKPKQGKRYGMMARVSHKTKWFGKEPGHMRIMLEDVIFLHNGKMFRDHVWVPVRRVKGHAPGEYIRFTAIAEPYYRSNETVGFTLTKIRKVQHLQCPISDV